ncbi:uncharacterized protein METZ01_LOCUS420330 [marine metagenome]|uniref:Uncharacterized protein n=1 Tax=marine metagenome TaxID=408172 RepID=A0A382X8G7_9ZZZZ
MTNYYPGTRRITPKTLIQHLLSAPTTCLFFDLSDFLGLLSYIEGKKRLPTRAVDTHLITPYTSYLLRGFE